MRWPLCANIWRMSKGDTQAAPSVNNPARLAHNGGESQMVSNKSIMIRHNWPRKNMKLSIPATNINQKGMPKEEAKLQRQLEGRRKSKKSCQSSWKK